MNVKGLAKAFRFFCSPTSNIKILNSSRNFPEQCPRSLEFQLFWFLRHAWENCRCWRETPLFQILEASCLQRQHTGYLPCVRFFKRFFYSLDAIFTYFSKIITFLRLTVWTLSSLGPELQLTDVNGRVHTLQRSSIIMMIWAGWILHLGSFIFNGLYYKLHPFTVSWSKIGTRNQSPTVYLQSYSTPKVYNTNSSIDFIHS